MRYLPIVSIAFAMTAACASTDAERGDKGEQGDKGDRGEPGLAGPPSLVRLDEVQSGDDCPFGGLAIKTGIDENRSAILEDAEATTTEYVCAGHPGGGSLIQVVEAAPSECSAGGHKLNVGLDDGDGGGTAGDDILQDGEVDQSAIACSGTNGFTSLHSISEAPVSSCPAGGARVDSGIDNGVGGGTAGNGSLESGEVLNTSFICNGAAGTSSLTRVSPESGGPNCPQGGKAIAVGLDANGNGVLDGPDEVQETTYLCGDFDPETVFYGDLTIRDAPQLGAITDVVRIVGSITVAVSSVTAISLPKLREVEGTLRFNDLTALANLSLPNLQRIDVLQIERNDALVSVELGGLRYAQALSIQFNDTLSTLNLRSLEAIDSDINLLGNMPLQEIALPKLRWVGGALLISGAGGDTPSVSALDLSLLNRVENRLAIENVNIDSLALPNLEYVGGPLLLGRLARLSSPSFPVLENVASSTLEIYRNPLLTDLAGFPLLGHTGGLFIVDNANLAACWALKLRDQIVARDGIDGGTSYSGNTGSGGCP